MVTHGSSMDYYGPCITPLSFKDSKLASHGNVMDHYVLRWIHHLLWNVPMVFRYYGFFLLSYLWLQLVLFLAKMVL